MTTASMSLIAPDIKISGQSLQAGVLQSLVEVKIRRQLRLPGRAVLTFVDDGFTLSAGNTFELGAKVAISLAAGSELFSGQVTGIDVLLERGSPEVCIVIDDLGYRLGLGNRVRTFLKVSYADIIRQMAGENGLKASISMSDATQHEYVLQADSDLGFLTEIVDRASADWYIEGNTLVVSDQLTAGPELTFGEGLWAFSVHATGLHPTSATTRGWAAGSKREVVAQGLPGQGPTAQLTLDHLSGAKLSGNTKVLTSRDNPSVHQEAQALATGRRRNMDSSAVTAKGTCAVNEALSLGGSVTVLRAGPVSGTYRVTEIQHVYNTRGFETRFTCGNGPPSGLVDTLSNSAISSFRHTGLMVGIVTDNNPTNGAAAGTIKVKFPTVADDANSHWARVASVGAGNSRGLTFMPEINDEVLVGFEGGDLRRPVILGGLYNGRDAASEWGRESSGTVGKRRITSRLGHYLEFGDGDSPTAKHVDIVLAGGRHRLRLGDDGITGEVPAGKPITLKSGDSSITIDGMGNISLKGNTVSIDAKQDVSINGLNITAKANVNLELAAQVAATMKANAKVELAASGPVMISGATVKVN